MRKHQSNLLPMQLLLKILISALGFFLGAQLLSGVKVKNYPKAFIVAFVVALLNFTLGTVLKIMSLGILSLGIFTLLLDAIIIRVADYFVDDFEVKNFWWALILAAIVALTESLLYRFL